MHFYPGTCWTFHVGKPCSGCSPYWRTSTAMEPLNRDLQVSFILLSPPVTPARVDRLDFLLQGYRSHLATYLVNGFRYGFRIQFISDGTRGESPNLKSALQNPDLVKSKLQNEISAGGIAGPYTPPPRFYTFFWRFFVSYLLAREMSHPFAEFSPPVQLSWGTNRSRNDCGTENNYWIRYHHWLYFPRGKVTTR